MLESIHYSLVIMWGKKNHIADIENFWAKQSGAEKIQWSWPKRFLFILKGM